MIRNSALFLLLLLSFNVFSADKFANIMSLPDNQQSPKADISAVKWLAGHWQGEAFGGLIEENWTPPLAGSMMGTFKLVVDNEIGFYEIETISEENGSLVFRLKHFHSNLKGWEEKDETFDFKLVKVTPNKVYFNGLTLERISEQELHIFVAVKNNGTTTEMKFVLNKVK